ALGGVRAPAGAGGGGYQLRAAGGAWAARRPFGGSVVALLVALHDPVAAPLEPARRRTPVTRHLVAVVALLADLDLAVAAHRRVRLAEERHLVLAHPAAEAVARRQVEGGDAR